MSPVFIDPSLRRARIMHACVGLFLVAAVGTVALFARGMRGGGRPAVALRSPRRGLAAARRPRPFVRPESGQRPKSGRTPGQPGQRRTPGESGPPQSEAPAVVAYVESTVPGALASVDRHADALAAVAATGLLVGSGGAVIDRLDPILLDVARSHQLPVHGVVQDLDEATGLWRPDRVEALGRSPRARARFAAELERACRDRGLAGVHLDLEEVDEGGWSSVVRVAADVERRLRPVGVELWVDVPAQLDPRVLSRLGAIADRVVVMAYDENADDGLPGPIASDRFVAGALDAAAAVLPGGKLAAGLGIYGYDWVGREPADSRSFVDAQSAAREAHVLPEWDRASGNPHFRYSDDEGAHEVWMLDGVTTWNQLGIAARHHAAAVTLWRLGGEDPGVWEAIAAARGTGALDRLSEVPPDDRVDNQGDGPFLSLALAPQWGRRVLGRIDDGRVTEWWERLPSPFLVRRAGVVAGKTALTFDDGPDPRYTPRILDELARARAPATFFVVGVNAEGAPGLVRRAFAEGHEVGNHSFTHPDVDLVGEARLQVELELTSRLVETLIGRRPLLYRPPSLADIEPRTPAGAIAFARAGSLGYLVVDADVDPRDWESPSAADLTRRVLDGARDGGVILLHDGGGDRSTTVEALPAIIDGLRRRGLAIVPLAELVGRRRDEVMPPAPSRASLSTVADRAVFGAGAAALGWAGRFLTVGLVLVGVRAVLWLAFALLAERRRRRGAVAAVPGPAPASVAVVIPAFNERAVIERTVRSVLASDVPLQVVVVDDGSTDGTAQVVSDRFRGDRRVTLIVQKNRGKPAALRTGFAWATGDVVVALDGDTLFAPDTVRRLVAPFEDPRVAAVAGTAEVGNRENALTACQALEYLVQQEVERRAWDAFGALPVVPGAVGAWRRRAVAEVGGFASDTLAEDADLAMALCRAGWRVVYAPDARAFTEAPASVGALLRQRYRWSFGVLQSMWKHRRALIERRAGAFGRIVLPAMVLFQVVLPLLVPAAVVGVAAAVAAGNVRPALIAAGALLVAELVQASLGCVLARRSRQQRSFRLLPWVLVARVIYRPLLLLVTLRSLARVLDGIPLGWSKLARRGTASAGLR